jgi:hypothetical protein
MSIYTSGVSNPENWLVKTAFQPVSIPQIATGYINDVNMPIYFVPSDCAIHCLISPAREFINVISTIKSI